MRDSPSDREPLPAPAGGEPQVLHLVPPAGVRHGTLAAGLVLLAIEAVLFWTALRLLGTFGSGPTAPHELRVFVSFGTVVTLQAMAVAGLAWVLVAIGRTELRLEPDVLAGAHSGPQRLVVSHPWRHWQGPPDRIAEAWREKRWLHIRVAGAWRTWHIGLGRGQDHDIDRLRRALSPAAWLDERQGRWRFARRILLVFLGLAAAAALGSAMFDLWLLPQLRPPVGSR